MMLEVVRPPFPPFDTKLALTKVRELEDLWNYKDPHHVASGCTYDCRWRNRNELINGRYEVEQFLTRKWARELNYRVIKELWSHTEARISIRFVYEWQDDADNHFRTFGNECVEFDEFGLVKSRFVYANDNPIVRSRKMLVWEGVRRPTNFPSISEMLL